MSRIRTIIPATSGFDIAVPLAGPPGFAFYSIVAWIVELSSDLDSPIARPICADQAENDDSSKIIRQPDGSIVFPNGPIFTKDQRVEALRYALAKGERESA